MDIIVGCIQNKQSVDYDPFFLTFLSFSSHFSLFFPFFFFPLSLILPHLPSIFRAFFLHFFSLYPAHFPRLRQVNITLGKGCICQSNPGNRLAGSAHTMADFIQITNYPDHQHQGCGAKPRCFHGGHHHLRCPRPGHHRHGTPSTALRMSGVA